MTFLLPGKRRPPFLVVLFLASLVLFSSGPPVVLGGEGGPAAEPLSAAALWQAAQEAVAAGNQAEAADLFGRLHRRYREAAQAEESLWHEARLRQEMASGHEEADWGRIRDLYRLYVTEYPEGEHVEEAYLQVGLAHYQMHFFREALIYLKLFSERFPRSRFRDEARYWQGRTLVEIGRAEEAEQVFQELAGGEDRRFRIKAQEALGDLYFATGRFQEALATYEGTLQEYSPEAREHFEIVRKLGLTHVRLGHEAAGRDHLYRYLNVVENSPHEAEVLFELGESSWRTGDPAAARVLYERALTKARPRDRASVLSRFRLALDESRRQQSLPPWQRQDADPGPAGDEPYQAVLESFEREPLAQDARYALLRRFMARDETERALLLAKAYLNAPQGESAQREEVGAALGELLAARVKKLLLAEEYRQVCDLYQEEHRYMSTYRKGRLLYLAGQAFEALGLYDQAAVVYYRALAGELTPEEKSDLYERRARVYLAKGDLGAAERLLAYLRDIYADRKEIGEVLYLSGRLRDAQGKAAEAASLYGQACRAVPAGEGSSFCLAEVQQQLGLDQVPEAASALGRSRQDNRLNPEDLQQGYEELGDGWRGKGQRERALAAYHVAIGDGMPQEGERAQVVHLRLADLYLELGRPGEGVPHFETASRGPDPLLAKSAEEGLRLADLERGMAESRSLVQPAAGAP